MVASILSATLTVAAYTVVVTNDGTTPAASFDYEPAPPDARSQAQWQTDCQNASLGIAADPPLGDGGPDDTTYDDSVSVNG